MNQFSFNWIRRNAIASVAAFLFLALLFVHTSRLFGSETLPVITAFLDLPLRALVILSLFDGLNQLRTPSERRFWAMVLTAFASWFVADIAFQPEGNRSLILGVLEDGAFLLFYPILLLALEQRPCRYQWPITGWGSRWLCAATGLGLILWTYLYFAGLTAILVPEAFLSEIPSYLFFATIDFILATILLARGVFFRGRWRVIYGLLGLALLMWGLTDLTDALWMNDIRLLKYGTPFDVLWSLPYFAVIAAAVYRNRTANAVETVPATTTEAGQSLVLSAYGYALTIPIIHLVVYLSGWLRELEVQRELLVVVGLTILVSSSFYIQLRERRRRMVTHEPRVQVLEDGEQQIQKMEALGSLAGGIAHDFNNLLMVLQSQIDTHLDQLMDMPDGRDFVGEVQKVIRRGGDLSHQLLAFGRKQVSRTPTVDPGAVVADTESLLRRTLGEHIELTLEAEPDAWHVSIEPGQLAQVLINLALNARAAMPKGGQLDIRVSNVSVDHSGIDTIKADQFVQIEVADNGRGMDEPTRRRVFEPFFTARQDKSGTGLGLAVVYGIVKQHAGYVTCESAEDKGTTFRIHLPRSNRAASLPKADPNSSAHDLGGEETILLVEDEPTVRSLTAEYLRGIGYQVIEASNGIEALDQAMIFDGPIHLLLTDVVMPKLGGPELAHRLSSTRKDTAVLFVTGYAQDLPTQGDEVNRQEVLQKPYSLVDLGATIRRMLDGGRN